MKRFGAIASLLLVAAIGVGAFVYAAAGSNNGHKPGAAVVKDDVTTSSTKTTTPAEDQTKTPNLVASESPVPKPSADDNVFHQGDNEQPELDGYEARRVFVGLSPSVAVPLREVRVELRGFVPFSTVNVATVPIPGSGATSVGLTGGSVLVDKHGRGRLTITAPKGAGLYSVTASGGGRSSAAVLKVVLKK